MENKSLSLEFKFDAEKGIIKGYASTFNNEDRVNDMVVKGAFQKSLTENTPKLLWQHKQDMPIGVVEKAYEDEKGLYIEARLTMGVKQADEARLLLKDGAIDSFSIGYKTVDSEFKGNTRVLKELKLFEVSIVTTPANEEATVTDVKSEEPKEKEIKIDDVNDLKDITNFLKQHALTKSERNAIVKKIKEFAISEYENKKAGERLVEEVKTLITQAKDFLKMEMK